MNILSWSQKLVALGFTHCQVEAKHNVIDTGAREAGAPAYISAKLSSDELENFRKRANDILSKFDINAYVQYTTVSVTKAVESETKRPGPWARGLVPHHCEG